MDTSLDIDPELEARVRELAERQQRSADSVMTEMIEQYVSREEAQASFHQEALDSWAEFEKTGLHITGDELSAWLKTWGTGAKIGPPSCHT